MDVPIGAFIVGLIILHFPISSLVHQKSFNSTQYIKGLNLSSTDGNDKLTSLKKKHTLPPAGLLKEQTFSLGEEVVLMTSEVLCQQFHYWV